MPASSDADGDGISTAAGRTPIALHTIRDTGTVSGRGRRMRAAAVPSVAACPPIDPTMVWGSLTATAWDSTGSTHVHRIAGARTTASCSSNERYRAATASRRLPRGSTVVTRRVSRTGATAIGTTRCGTAITVTPNADIATAMAPAMRTGRTSAPASVRGTRKATAPARAIDADSIAPLYSCPSVAYH